MTKKKGEEEGGVSVILVAEQSFNLFLRRLPKEDNVGFLSPLFTLVNPDQDRITELPAEKVCMGSGMQSWISHGWKVCTYESMSHNVRWYSRANPSHAPSTGCSKWACRERTGRCIHKP